MSALSAENKQLSQEEWDKFASIGAQATLSHQSGGASFPSYSKSAAYARKAGPVSAQYQQGRTRQGDDSIDILIRDQHRDWRNQKREERLAVARHAADLKEFHNNKVNVDRVFSQRSLLAPDGCQLWCFPHPCLSFEAHMSVKDASSEALLGEQTASSLRKEWQRMHMGIREESFSTIAHERQPAQQISPSRCCLAGRCCCRQDPHTRFWVKAQQALQKQLLTNKQDELMAGRLILEWKADLRVCGEQPHKRWTHVALHYKKPWRPTLLEVEICNSSADDEVAGSINEFKPSLGEDERLQFSLPLSWVTTLDTDVPWELCVWELSMAQVPCATFHGVVYAKKLEGRANIWAGQAEPRRNVRARVPFHMALDRVLRSANHSAGGPHDEVGVRGAEERVNEDDAMDEDEQAGPEEEQEEQEEDEEDEEFTFDTAADALLASAASGVPEPVPDQNADLLQQVEAEQRVASPRPSGGASSSGARQRTSSSTSSSSSSSSSSTSTSSSKNSNQSKSASEAEGNNSDASAGENMASRLHPFMAGCFRITPKSSLQGGGVFWRVSGHLPLPRQE